MILVEEGERELTQMSTLRHSLMLDVQPPHNLYSYPERDWLDRQPLEPEKIFRGE